MWVRTLGHTGHDTLWLIEGDAQGLGTHAGRTGILGLVAVFLRLTGAHFLDLVLACLSQAVWDQADVLVVQSGAEVVPVGNNLPVSAVFFVCTPEHIVVDGVEKGWNGGAKFSDWDGGLAVLARDITAGNGDEPAS